MFFIPITMAKAGQLPKKSHHPSSTPIGLGTQQVPVMESNYKVKNKGRLVVAANHMVAGTKTYHSQLIFSDDKGETWKLGGIVNEHGGNESSVVELKMET